MGFLGLKKEETRKRVCFLIRENISNMLPSNTTYFENVEGKAGAGAFILSGVKSSLNLKEVRGFILVFPIRESHGYQTNKKFKIRNISHMPYVKYFQLHLKLNKIHEKNILTEQFG